MANQWTDLIKLIGDAGLAKAVEDLKALTAAADSPLKKLVLTLVANAVEKFGPMGIAHVQEIVEDLMTGRKQPDLSVLDIMTASDLWAEFQNAEANQKSEIRAFVGVASETAGKVFGGLLKGLLATAL